MRIFFKVQLSSVISTVADLSITFALSEIVKVWCILSGIIGTVSGGVINFIINRNIVFNISERKILNQASNYLLVWTGYLGLSAIIFYMQTEFFRINYMLSKVSTAVVLGVSYNYLLQKYFVFRVK